MVTLDSNKALLSHQTVMLVLPRSGNRVDGLLLGQHVYWRGKLPCCPGIL
jgi:hypothetical protein